MTHSRRTPTERLDEIEARANAATDGPWESAAWPSKGVSIVNTADRVLLNVTADADAVFIEHARTDVPALVAALRAVLAVHWYDPENEGCGDCRTFAALCNTQRAVAEALGVAL